MNPTYEEALKYGDQKQYKVIPVSTELYADLVTPIQVLKRLKYVSKHCYLLESAHQDKQWGRYTFLGYDPSLCLTCNNNKLTIRMGTTIESETKDPSTAIRKIIADHKSPRFHNLPPFTGGLVGYFSYDYIKYAEPTLKLETQDEDDFQDVDLMLFDKVIAFDHYQQKIILIVNIRTDDISHQYHKAELELKAITDLILNGTPFTDTKGRLLEPMTGLFNKEQYCDMVKKAKEHITEGDIFQVVLSNRLSAAYEGSLLDTYRVLRTTNPSPYMFYFSGDDLEIAGASPETLVKLEDGVLHTFPLAGTRPRGATSEKDAALIKDLLSDEKERAEHNMLVDLGRNDLGKISRFGSVCVEKYMEIEQFSHVMHIGSTVRGEIRDDADALDAIYSILPAGTLSGAPKLSACKIINELEHNKRGIYGGAIGYIDFTGNLDTCIAIRIAYKRNGKVFVRSGAGIVADSVPESEYNECINKAKAVVNALNTASGGIDYDTTH